MSLYQLTISATLWNSLPCNLRQERSLNRFKVVLNGHFSGAPRTRKENWRKFGHDVSAFQTYLRSLGMGEGSSESARLGQDRTGPSIHKTGISHLLASLGA